MGGGNQWRRLQQALCIGLSPRGRGKLVLPCASCSALRSIPAWAGETDGDIDMPLIMAVYPRVGGGNPREACGRATLRGLSPRGRGKQDTSAPAQNAERSIPAWAGETVSQCIPPYVGTVYPRVGGGNSFTLVRVDPVGGLSPRGRGKLTLCIRQSIHTRSIPAWAGETQTPMRPNPADTVYPRVGGGNGAAKEIPQNRSGLSPRGRGKPMPNTLSSSTARSIPAWAGETRQRSLYRQSIRVYPRVGGGNRAYTACVERKGGLSPRGRGKRLAPFVDSAVLGSIPAWAGETETLYR